MADLPDELRARLNMTVEERWEELHYAVAEQLGCDDFTLQYTTRLNDSSVWALALDDIRVEGDTLDNVVTKVQRILEQDKGLVALDVETTTPEGEPIMTVTCPVCDGKGVTVNGLFIERKCSNCGGKKYVVRDEPQDA